MAARNPPRWGRAGRLEAAFRFLASIMSLEEGQRLLSSLLKTWNPVTGCLHDCVYCWARRLALTKLRHTPRYREGFKPRLNPGELRRRFGRGLVFVSDMGDMWGDWVPDEWIRRVLSHIKRFPGTWFLFLTKNPRRYHDFIDEMPSNAILGATIETNRDTYFLEGSGPRISRAPPPSSRYRAMRELDWPLKFVSAEPILDFDLDVFTRWIEEMGAFMVRVGYDNYGNRLPEPPLSKTMELIRRLEGSVVVLRGSIRPSWRETLEGLGGGGGG